MSKSDPAERAVRDIRRKTRKQYSAEIDIYVLLFWRYFLALALFLPWLMRVGAGALRTRRLGLHLGRAALMVIHGGTLLVAILMTPLAEATSLIFTAPLFATMLAALFLREKVGARRWLALAVGFAGVLVILGPGVGAFNPASGLVLISALTGAGVVVTGKVLLRTESAESTVFYLTLFSVPFAAIVAALYWQVADARANPLAARSRPGRQHLHLLHDAGLEDRRDLAGHAFRFPAHAGRGAGRLRILCRDARSLGLDWRGDHFLLLHLHRQSRDARCQGGGRSALGRAIAALSAGPRRIMPPIANSTNCRLDHGNSSIRSSGRETPCSLSV